MHRNRSASSHQFAMVPRADIPRSAMRMQKTHKTTFDATDLIPIFCEEVLPGDKFKVNMTAFARLATPLFPIMDNLHYECFWFFVPNRLVWDKWQRFMGEQPDPSDSIDFTIPQTSCPANGYAALSIFDHFGLPCIGQVGTGNVYSHSVLPLRMYNLIWNEWFRDENLTSPAPVETGDSDSTTYVLRPRLKRHDYFTSCMPWPQKGDPISIPLSASPTNLTAFGGPGVVVKTHSASVVAGAQSGMFMKLAAAGGTPTTDRAVATGAGGAINTSASALVSTGMMYPSNLWADLAEGTAGTINALRSAFQIQKLLERDARGGTRYTEIVRSHFGVISPDARLQRPEYLGGSSIAIAINPVAQTSASAADGTDTPQGTLAAIGTGLLRSSFTQAFTEHGYIIGLSNVRADLTYQQGLRRHWSRQTRYDFYFPVFAMLGEQAVLQKEIYCQDDSNFENDIVFGYQERWAEYRYNPNEITGLFRSTTAQTIDPWHLAEKFATAPGLNNTFITDPTKTTLERAIAVGAEAAGQQFICDMFFDCTVVRPMPLYSVPGMVDHF